MLLKNYADDSINKEKGIGHTTSGMVSCLQQATNYIKACFIINQERRSLAKLTSTELQDIGLHPAAVRAECSRSFFDIPANRWKP